jgi:UDP-N-acetylmuramate: L-alanyl-gamma-D-glutamyl-meso-diaminopimelate ligase
MWNSSGFSCVITCKKGYQLSGSDEKCYPPMDKVINDLGISFRQGFRKEHIEDADLVIIGNVCGASNPEAEAARENGIPTLSLPEAIERFFIEDKKSLVVCGTHGKTTTTGLLAHIFSSAGRNPGYMVGGVMQGGEPSSSVGTGDYFIIEGDEYDTAYFDKSPKFLHYKPQTAIVTSLEFDHVDIYKDMEAYTQAFLFLAQEIPEDGNLVVWGDDAHVRKLTEHTKGKTILYGLEQINDVTAQNIIATEKGQSFDLIIRNEHRGNYTVPLSGKHNLLNTLATCTVALQYGLTEDEIRHGLKSFSGMKRRQEVVAEIGDVTIIDDFAHHPTAVRETISAIRSKYAGRRLLALFEPRSATSRRKIFEEDYGHAFSQADIVFISTPALRPVDNPNEFINPPHIVEIINQEKQKAYSVSNADELVEHVAPMIQSGDVLLVMSNGSFDNIHTKLTNVIASL